MKERIKRLPQTAVFQCIVIALVLDMILEVLGRHSLKNTLSYIVSEPLVFLYNCSIIFLTLTLAMLMRKRVFGYGIISFLWLLLGATNSIVLGFRITPFSAADMLMVKNTITIIDKYFSTWQIVLMVVVLVLALVGIIVLYLKAPTITGNIYRIRTTVFIVGTFCIVMLFTKLALNAQAISDNFSNLSTAYKKYGFAYCFSNSVIDVGISQPSDYSEEFMTEIKEELDAIEDSSGESYADSTPNIIFVQLESFMDPSYVYGLEFSENPIPTFTYLKETCTSGYLTMPAIGAGTANSEFEVISGFDTSYFGAGEYPYKTILKTQTCETIATQLKKLGYSTHAIHNHDGTFYSRHIVYANLGFDTFTPMEYMYNVTTTQKNWERDDVLTEEILKAMESTEERDLVYTISVQGHGRYPTTLKEGYDYPITVTGTGDENLDTQWTYYCNQLHEMDEFIADLLAQFEDYEEEVIVVMYGDHLPGFDLSEEDIVNGDLYQTEYFIWSNIEGFGGNDYDEDLDACELSTKLFNMVGFEKTYIQKIHSVYSIDSDEYDSLMGAVQYDMLYGQQYLFPDGYYEATDMTYGIDPIYITDIYEGTYIQIDEDDPDDPGVTLTGYYITGENFNECTFVWMNDTFKSGTIYIDSCTLFLPDTELSDGDEIAVAQVGDDDIEFGISEYFTYSK